MFINLKLSLKKKNLMHILVNHKKKNKGSHSEPELSVVLPIFANKLFFLRRTENKAVN